MKKRCLWALTSLLAACAPAPEGTYANGMLSYTFKNGGKVRMTDFLGAVSLEFDYRRKGSQITVISPYATEVFTMLDDGTLRDPRGLILKRPLF
jgi:hypothetical protein